MKRYIRLLIVVFVLSTIAAISCKEKEPTGDPTEKLNFFFSCDHDALQVAFMAMINYGDKFEWDFGDHNTSDERNPVHTYAKGGEYDVTLKVTGKGETKEYTKKVAVGLSFFKLDFSFSAEQNALRVDFTAKLDMNANFLWDFGDGNTSTEKNPAHAYANGGTYTVKLTVSAHGETQEISKQVAMGLSSFKPDFSFTPHHDAMQVDFTFNLDYDVVLEWDFGDGNTSDEENPTHTYAAYGTYEVILKVTAKGETKEITKQVALGLSAFPLNFTFKIDADDALMVSFTSVINYEIEDYLWYFGDGTTSDEKNPVHTYADEGDYEVTLTVSAKGETKEITKEVKLESSN